MARFHFHKIRIIIPFIGFVLFISFYYHVSSNRKTDFRKRVILHSHVACIQPSQNLETLNFESLITTKDILVCNGKEDWVIVTNSEAVIVPTMKKKYGEINCTFTELVRVDDITTVEGASVSSTDRFVFVKSDFYAVSCLAQNGNKWSSTLVGVRRDEALMLDKGWNAVPDHAVKLNVLMLGFDSLSHNSFIRSLPRTYRFLMEVLKTNVLQGYNIVGDGTSQALIPILTGKTELELPETRKRMGEFAQFVNIFPFVWNDFSRNGYVTLFAEDQPHEGCFNYRLRGFDVQPTDHYMRTFFTYMFPTYDKHRNYCFYSSPRHKVFLKYLTDFFDVYSKNPKFAFAFHSELSHNDHNLVSIADEDILHSLRVLKEEGHLNETVLIVFSDHGNRFSAFRSAQQRKQEERLPFFSVYLPPRFRENYPSAADNVKVNSKRLTTPFDIHPTLKDLIAFSGAKLGKTSSRGISLFSEIPPSRTCRDAFIEPHWCACLTWDPIPTTDDKALEASKALIHYINSYTAPQRSFCHEMKLLSIDWAALLLPNEGLINGREMYDYNGFLPDFGDRTAISQQVYQVSVTAVPSQQYFHTSNSLPTFEASLTYSIKQDSFSVKIDDISRVNKYGDQPHCIMKNFPHLRKFCYCLQPP